MTVMPDTRLKNRQITAGSFYGVYICVVSTLLEILHVFVKNYRSDLN
jgi:hypothetical protein